MPYTLRPCRETDLPAMGRIYKEAISLAQPQYYSPEQVRAWSSHAEDIKVFAQWIMQCLTTVAVDLDDCCLGFCGYEEHGRIASLFVDPRHGRTGIGSTLLTHALDDLAARGLSEIRTEASEYSKPLFIRFGFRVKEVEEKVIRGTPLSRYVMIKS